MVRSMYICMCLYLYICFSKSVPSASLNYKCTGKLDNFWNSWKLQKFYLNWKFLRRKMESDKSTHFWELLRLLSVCIYGGMDNSVQHSGSTVNGWWLLLNSHHYYYCNTLLPMFLWAAGTGMVSVSASPLKELMSGIYCIVRGDSGLHCEKLSLFQPVLQIQKMVPDGTQPYSGGRQ